jgi:hypothetical protein
MAGTKDLPEDEGARVKLMSKTSDGIKLALAQHKVVKGQGFETFL